MSRLLGLGATRAGTDHGADRTWVVMADVEGNEFCVVRTLAPQRDQALSSNWRLARALAALSESTEYVQYERDPPPCDRTHQPP
ncbi:hypothetical protein M877_08265 [Streptomyces niveus NCIMB 11891]|nr:hypothetical protein M877_08265 [Streptomyces niveus NCIMB 11891]